MSYLTLQVRLGDSINDVAKQAQRISSTLNTDVQFEFSEVKIIVEPGVFLDDILTGYEKALRGSKIARIEPRKL